MSKKIYYLSVVQVLAIHDQMIKRFGGSSGIKDIRLVQSAVARPQSTFDGADLYKTIFDKTAALLQSLLKNHPFIDGNKRTALTSAGIFLVLNRYKLINKFDEEINFTLDVANNKLNFREISMWFSKNSVKTNNSF